LHSYTYHTITQIRTGEQDVISLPKEEKKKKKSASSGRLVIMFCRLGWMAHVSRRREVRLGWMAQASRRREVRLGWMAHVSRRREVSLGWMAQASRRREANHTEFSYRLTHGICNKVIIE
jgi:hypothetical protein